MSGVLTKAEIAQGSMSNSECLTRRLAHLKLRRSPCFRAATLAALPSMSLFPKAPFLLSIYNPSMSLATLHEVGPHPRARTQYAFKNCTAIPLLYAGGADNGLVKFRCRQIAADGE